MNRCSCRNGFSVGGDCRTWDSEFTCLASNSAFWSEDCEWIQGTCSTETEADHIRVVVAASKAAHRAERIETLGLPLGTTEAELESAEAQVDLVVANMELDNKNAARAVENPSGLVECPGTLAMRVEKHNFADHSPTTLSGDIESTCNDSRINDSCRSSNMSRNARLDVYVEGQQVEGGTNPWEHCSFCYERDPISEKTYACHPASAGRCERKPTECHAYKGKNKCKSGHGVTIESEDDCY